MYFFSKYLKKKYILKNVTCISRIDKEKKIFLCIL